MPLPLRRTIATLTTLSAGLAASLVLASAPAAHSADRVRVDFGFNARSFGAAVRTNDVDLRPVRAGFANTSCTRTLGRETRARAGQVPVADLIELGLVDSRNRTYRSGRKVGIRAVTTVGSISVGQGGGPRLSVTGLRSTANAFSDGGTLKTQESFDIEGLDITGVPSAGGPLGDLLGAIDGGVDQVLDVLREQDQPIEIPGLARISLGAGQSTITRGRSAASRTTGLRIQLLVGDLADVTVGSALARIGKNATAGVLGMSTQALEGSLVNDAIGVGATNRRTIGCEGSAGKVETFRRASSGIAAPLVVDIQDSVARQRGEQRGNRGTGMSRHQIERVQVVPDQLSPLLPTVTVLDLDTKVTVDGNFARKGSKRVGRTVSSSVGELRVRGRKVPLPAAGRTRSYDGGSVQVTRRIVQQGFFGARVTALRVKYLPEVVGPGLEPVTLNLAVVDADFLRG